MDSPFVNRAKQIILEHIDNESFGVSELSQELGYSKSQVLRKLKAEVDLTISELIKNVRLQEAARMLREEDLTASEVSYRVGFGSPSYFNKCFHEHFKITPGDYKASQKNELIINGNDLNSYRGESHHKNYVTKTLLGTLTVLLVILVFHFLKDAYHKRESGKEYAIAVLPFLNLSEENSQYLTDGITDAIILELSKNSSLRVISRGSSMALKGTKKSYADIAKELDVNLLLEGSILFVQDSLSVVAQLIEPLPKEKHLWANKYQLKIENVFHFINEVSSSVAREIHLAILPFDQKSDTYFLNPEAYDFYLRGKHLYVQQTPETVKNAIECLNKSVQIDSNFSPAYATLAESYILMNKFNSDENEKERNIKLGQTAIDKSLEKGPYLAEAFITKGHIYEKFNWDWEGMRHMTMKGLALDPNHSYGHTQMSKYYLFMNDLNKAIEEAVLAEKLDPLNPRVSCIVAEQYFYNRQFDKSLKKFQEITELHPNYAFGWDGLGYVQWVTGDKDGARQSFVNFQKLMKNRDMEEKMRLNTLDEAAAYFIEKAKGKAPLYCSNPSQIAMVYQFMDEKDNALDYLEAAYAMRDGDLPKMLLKPHFESLYDDSRFIDLLEKTGVHISRPIRE
ncbi:helix-turn-helix domain-containing protein [Namhaeicola litoreus]|uniref:Helix-turn-helix domain-containing protein n=1 Tax=Namhaeicola litoreus TaxID=1052145 RepID=A0ABW3Y6L2_9FLAO